jgi:3-oxoacyl-[acyl-carrier protein] reductase
LITGGSSGIGLAIGHRFAADGATVALVGSSDLDKVSAAAEDVSRDGVRAHPFIADLSEPEDIERLLIDVKSTLGDVDILVNAAGVWFPTPLANLTDAQINQMVAINLTAPMLLVAALAPSMMERRSGHIVNIASVAATMPSAGYSLYATTKAGVIAFTKAGSIELAACDVAMNCISPGNTATPMNEAVRLDPANESRREWIAQITPSNRMFTPAEEIAEAALFLVDGRVKGMYGTVIEIAEGRTAGLPAW